MKSRVTFLLIAGIIFGLCCSASTAQTEDAPELHAIWDIVVLPSKVAEYEETAKKSADLYRQHKVPYKWTAASTDDLHYYFLAPVKNLGEVDAMFISFQEADKMIGSEADQIKLYTRLAKGGVGLIVLGYAYVQENGHSVPCQIGIFSDEHIPGLKKLADEVHNLGAKVAMQIAHAGRQTVPGLIGGQTPMAPSAIEPDPTFDVAPREMSIEEIHETIASFGAWIGGNGANLPPWI